MKGEGTFCTYLSSLSQRPSTIKKIENVNLNRKQFIYCNWLNILKFSIFTEMWKSPLLWLYKSQWVLSNQNEIQDVEKKCGHQPFRLLYIANVGCRWNSLLQKWILKMFFSVYKYLLYNYFEKHPTLFWQKGQHRSSDRYLKCQPDGGSKELSR